MLLVDCILINLMNPSIVYILATAQSLYYSQLSLSQEQFA